MIGLKDASLFRQEAYLAGRWCGADNGGVTAIMDPATGSELGKVPAMGQPEAERAIRAADRAWSDWRARPGKERANLMRGWFDLILAHAEDLARILTHEQGKPLAEARGEIAYAASFIEWFAEEAKRLYGDVIPATVRGRRLLTIRQPVGVVAAITPWNFPAAMITRKVGPALAAGCPIIVKPAPQTPFTALALAELSARAGIPGNILQIITGSATEIGRTLTESPIVRKLTFTGSTAIGKLLMAQCAGTVKKVSLELGGNAPFIVFDDADLDEAIRGTMASKFRNMGQTCVCANRLLVQDGIYEAYLAKLAEAVAGLRLGNGLEADTTQGPLVDAAAVTKVEAHVADALNHGARLVAGGRRHELGGFFFEPTILADATIDMLVSREETFGPVASVFRFSTEEEAVRMANDTEFGLAAYFYTRDIGRVFRVGEALEYGIIGINDGLPSVEVAPFGGMKQSGIGREGSRYGIEDYTEIKYLCLGGIGA